MNKIRGFRSDKVFDGINITLSIILFIIFTYPLYFIIIASISDPNAVWNNQVILWPRQPTLEGYQKIFTYSDILMGYKNSIFYTFFGVFINLFVTITAAYPLSRKDFMLRGPIMKLYTFTMFFSGGLIPTFLLVKGLGMYDSIWALLIPTAASMTNIIIMRTFFQSSIPLELQEAAILDGCTNLGFLWRIVLPLSKAILAVMALYYGVGHWNAYFNAMIYLSDRSKFPLQLILREILLTTSFVFESGGDPEALLRQQRLGDIIKFGVVVVSVVPALVVYPFVQKHFVKGIMIGSIKG